ncbi:MAG: hypothetical protein J6K45_02390 [Clostridia bacterium]|nr:hypothetical protein [Clostridia bacterium]
MDNVKVNEDLSVLISDLTRIEQDKLMLMATIYTRKNEEIKQDKLNKFNMYLKDQLLLYKRDENRFINKIESLTKLYEDKIERMIEQYTIEYNYLQNEVVFAQTNQKIAIANFVASKKGMDKARLDNNLALIEKSNKKIFATAQKKLNYDVVIDECTGRLQKCIDDSIDTIDNIFNVANNKILDNKKGFLEKIKYFFKITFKGDELFEENVLIPLERDMKILEETVYTKISEVKTEMLISIAQLEKIRKEINHTFNETLNKVS